MRRALVALFLGFLLMGPPMPVSGYHQARMLWVPLDSRPVNTDEVRLFGQAASFEVHLPPAGRLDWYATRRSDFAGLMTWLSESSRSGDTQVIFTNNLLTGGLIASRDVTMYKDLESRLSALRQTLAQLPDGRRILVHVLPRVLPTQFRTDGSPNPDYEWREQLAERSELIHRIALTPGAREKGRLTELENAIPPPVRERYDALLEANEQIVDAVLTWAKEGLITYAIVGLDDARPLGMANLLHGHVESRAAAEGLQDRVFRHYGADEIGFLVLAREAAARAGISPSLHVQYDHAEAPGLLLPYEGSTLAESVLQKLTFLGAQSSTQAADRLFLHTRSNREAAAASGRTIDQISAARDSGRSVTVVDVTSPGERDSEFLAALSRGTPLASMNYSGWNTASNALGTGMAMAALTQLHREAGATAAQALALAEFRALRFSYDWVYQSHKPALSQWAHRNGINPDRFGPGIDAMNERLSATVLPEMEALLRGAAGPALIEVQGRVYGICVQRPAISFRWERTFEVEIKPSLRLADPRLPGSMAHCLNRP